MTSRYPYSVVIALLAATMANGPIVARDADPPSSFLTGRAFQYQVVRGDTITLVSARYGIHPSDIIERNRLKPNAVLTPGQILELENLHIVPVVDDDVALVINVPQRMLFLDEGDRASGYPIAVGRRDWPTPLGDFNIVVKETEPTWDVPESIQEEMRREGRVVLEKVPPGPENPLGAFWLGLSLGSVGIHGTNAPSSIFRSTTHGCIRMHPDDIAALFPRVVTGTRGRIVYSPVLLAKTANGIFVEAHPDIYRRMAGDPLALVRDIANAVGIANEIDWVQVARVLKARRGMAVPVANATSTRSSLN